MALGVVCFPHVFEYQDVFIFVIFVVFLWIFCIRFLCTVACGPGNCKSMLIIRKNMYGVGMYWMAITKESPGYQ